MTNTTLLAIGVVVPLTILVGGAAAFIWYTERKRKQAIDVCEIPYRSRRPSFLYRNKGGPFIEDGIEVCSPNLSKNSDGAAALDFKFQHELPSLQFGGDGRSDSAIHSPMGTFDKILELEGTPGKHLAKIPSKAKLRHSTDEQCFKQLVRKEAPNRASLQPYGRYYARHSLQPISTGSTSDKPRWSKSGKERIKSEIQDETSSPTVSAISEFSTRGRTSNLSSDVSGDIPAWIKRMSVQEMAEKNWRVDGEISTPTDIPKKTDYL